MASEREPYRKQESYSRSSNADHWRSERNAERRRRSRERHFTKSKRERSRSQTPPPTRRKGDIRKDANNLKQRNDEKRIESPKINNEQQTINPANLTSKPTISELKSSLKSQDQDVDYFAVVDEDEILQERRRKREEILSKYKKNDSVITNIPKNTNSVNLDTGNSNTLRDSVELGGFENDVSAFDYDPTAEDIAHKQELINQAKNNNNISSFQKKAGIKTPEDDMFGEAEMLEVPVITDNMKESTECKLEARVQPQTISQDVNPALQDNWDDHEGYYRLLIGERVDSRYTIQSMLGKGVFSTVVRATDSKTGTPVAVKFIRNNEMMHRAGQKEITILKKLQSLDPEGIFPNQKPLLIFLFRQDAYDSSIPHI